MLTSYDSTDREKWPRISEYAPNYPRENVGVEKIDARFSELSTCLRGETQFFSASRQIKQHRAFVELVKMGHAIVPHLISQLEHEVIPWVVVLREITKANPVGSEDLGKVERIKQGWRDWYETYQTENHTSR